MQLRIDWCSSDVVSCAIEPGQTTGLVVENGDLLAVLPAVFARGRGYLVLRPE